MTTELSTWPDDAIPEKWIESLFERMLLSYGSKFSEQWKGIDSDKIKKHWAISLGELTREELKVGVSKLGALDWPPSLPQFIKLCRPPIDALHAYYEAVAGVQARQTGQHGTWTHPAIFWAAMPLAFDLSNQTFSQIKVRWEHAFGEQMDRGQWAAIPEPMLALDEPKNRLTREEAASMLKKLGALDMIKKPSGGQDYKAWARKIKERQRQGDRTLTLIQVKFVDEALAA